jgi:ent-kaurene oxidase
VWLTKNFPIESFSIPLISSVIDLITSSTSRDSVGPSLCRNEEWLRTTTGYTLDVHKASEELLTYPAIVRPVVRHFLSSCRQLKGRFGVARRLLLPAFEERRSRNGKDYQDMLQWLVGLAQGRDGEPDRLVKRILFLNMAAIYTTATTAANVLLDLCARPEYIGILREEMSSQFEKMAVLNYQHCQN